jgi:hypothetical protein
MNHRTITASRILSSTMRVGLGLACCIVAWSCGGTQAQQSSQIATATPQHPLDPALKMARENLDYLKTNVQDYTCTIIKRERIKGELTDHQYMSAKIRHRKVIDNKLVTPFSVYLKFLKPKSVEGREVIWVEGRNDGDLIAHETGLLNIKRAFLAPTGFMAMMGQRYPITEIGTQNLIEELLVKGEKDRQYGECDVQFFDNASINKRVCRMIQVVHPVRREHFEFHKAQIFTDRELNMPVRYAAWSWPTGSDPEPVLEEEYTYVDIKVNVGLTDEDFNPDNADYNYPRL